MHAQTHSPEAGRLYGLDALRVAILAEHKSLPLLAALKARRQKPHRVEREGLGLLVALDLGHRRVDFRLERVRLGRVQHPQQL